MGKVVDTYFLPLNDIIFVKYMTVAFDHTVTKVLTTKDIKVSLGRKKEGKKKKKIKEVQSSTFSNFV